MARMFFEASQTIHGTGIFTYIYHQNKTAIHVGKYTVRPMGMIWDFLHVFD